jgi:hypothetical protein
VSTTGKPADFCLQPRNVARDGSYGGTAARKRRISGQESRAEAALAAGVPPKSMVKTGTGDILVIGGNDGRA